MNIRPMGLALGVPFRRSFSFFQVERTVLNVCATLAINKVKESVTYIIFDPRLMFGEENYKRSILLNYWNMVKLIKKKD